MLENNAEKSTIDRETVRRIIKKVGNLPRVLRERKTSIFMPWNRCKYSKAVKVRNHSTFPVCQGEIKVGASVQTRFCPTFLNNCQLNRIICSSATNASLNLMFLSVYIRRYCQDNFLGNDNRIECLFMILLPHEQIFCSICYWSVKTFARVKIKFWWAWKQLKRVAEKLLIVIHI